MSSNDILPYLKNTSNHISSETKRGYRSRHSPYTLPTSIHHHHGLGWRGQQEEPELPPGAAAKSLPTQAHLRRRSWHLFANKYQAADLEVSGEHIFKTLYCALSTASYTSRSREPLFASKQAHSERYVRCSKPPLAHLSSAS